MNPRNMINMVKKFTDQYGVTVTWQEQETTVNSRGRPIEAESGIPKSAKVLILKEKYSPLQAIQVSTGLSQDYARYILALPDIDLKKDMVVTDAHNMKWKLGIVDWFDIAGVSVAKQAALTEVN